MIICTNNLVHLVGIAIICCAALSDRAHAAEDLENTVYFGVGVENRKIQTANSGKPFSVGYIKTSSATDTVFGFDFSGEGVLIDSTYGRTSVSRSNSFNLLVGRALNDGGMGRFDISLVVGVRQEAAECPASYLGYRCYANEDPTTTYGLNYGAVFTWSYNKIMLGIRATGESAQALVGYKF